jgi:hypothetical protein
MEIPVLEIEELPAAIPDQKFQKRYFFRGG